MTCSYAYGDDGGGHAGATTATWPPPGIWTDPLWLPASGRDAEIRRVIAAPPVPVATPTV